MQSNDLAVAYYLKEQFYDFMESKNRDEAYRKLRKFILSVQASELEEFKPAYIVDTTEKILSLFTLIPS